MFTVGAIVLFLCLAWCADRQNRSDPPSIDARGGLDMIRYSRQDLRLIAYLLCGIIVMLLGVVADRIH